MNLWKLILVTLVIFSTGAITGGLVARKTAAVPPDVSSGQSVTNRPPQGFRPDRMLRRDFLERAQAELELTPEQMEQVEMIVSESQVRTRELWEEFAPQMRAEFRVTQEKIRALLTPDQQAEFEQLMLKRRHPRRGEGDRRRPGMDADPQSGPPPPPEPPPGG